MWGGQRRTKSDKDQSDDGEKDDPETNHNESRGGVEEKIGENRVGAAKGKRDGKDGQKKALSLFDDEHGNKRSGRAGKGIVTRHLPMLPRQPGCLLEISFRWTVGC